MKRAENFDPAERLTYREQMVMKCIWDVKDHDISSIEIQTMLKDNYDVSFERSTIATFLLHLREKKFIESYKKGQVYYYLPLIKEDEYLSKISKEFIDFWFDGSLSGFVTAFASDTETEFTKGEAARVRKAMRQSLS